MKNNPIFYNSYFQQRLRMYDERLTKYKQQGIKKEPFEIMNELDKEKQ